MVVKFYEKHFGRKVMKSNLHSTSSDFEQHTSYDFKLAKIESSIKWLLIIASSETNNLLQQIPSITSGLGLHPTVEHLLSSGVIYLRAAEKILGFKSTRDDALNEMIEILQENKSCNNMTTVNISKQQLQRSPLNIECHLQLIDMLVISASTNLWAPHHQIAAKVKLIQQNNKHFTPNNLQDSIFYWINTVVQKVKYLDESFAQINASMMNDQNKVDKQDGAQVLRHKGYYPVVQSSTNELCNSCVLVYLLHYYCPFHIRLENLSLKPDNTLSESICNLRVILRFCYNALFNSDHDVTMMLDHLAVDDFVHAHDEFRPHFLGFYSYLFYVLEVAPNKQFVKPRNKATQENVLMSSSNSKTNCSTSTCVNTDTRDQQQMIETVGKLKGNFNKSTIASTTNSVIEQVQPQVESLLSDATKRSFLVNNIATNATSMKPTLPSSPFQSKSEDTLPTKWKKSENFVPLSTSCSTDSSQVGSHLTTASSDPAKKFYERQDIKMTNLLARVNIDPDEETLTATNNCGGAGESINISSDMDDNILLDRDDVNDDVSWDGFVKKPTSSALKPTNQVVIDDGLKIETFRTENDDVTDLLPQPPQTNSSISTMTSRSDLTDVTMMNDVLRGTTPNQSINANNNALRNSTIVSENQTPMMSSEQPFGGNHGQPFGGNHGQRSDQFGDHRQPFGNDGQPFGNNGQDTTTQHLQNSYTLNNKFHTIDSARAAGYPIINPCSSSSNIVTNSSSYDNHQQQQLHHNGIHNNNNDDHDVTIENQLFQSNGVHPQTCTCPASNTSSPRPVMTSSAPLTSTTPTTHGSHSPTTHGTTSSNVVRRSRMSSMRNSVSMNNTSSLRNPDEMTNGSVTSSAITSSAPTVRLRKSNVGARRRIAKVKSCFDMKSITQVDPAPKATIRDSKILEISEQLDLLRVQIDELRQNPPSMPPRSNQIHSTPFDNQPSAPPLLDITSITPPGNYPPQVRNNRVYIRHQQQQLRHNHHQHMITTDDIDEVQRKLDLANQALLRHSIHDNSGDHRRAFASVTPSTIDVNSVRNSHQQQFAGGDLRRNLFPESSATTAGGGGPGSEAEYSNGGSSRRSRTSTTSSYTSSSHHAYSTSPPTHHPHVYQRDRSTSSPAPPHRGGIISSSNNSLHRARHRSVASNDDLLHMAATASEDGDSSNLHVENEVASKDGHGFTILEDNSSPQQDIDKKKKQFFQNRLRKEKDLRQKQMKREVETLERKQKAREKEEAAARKKQLKEEKRKLLLEKHKKLKKDQEQVSIAYQRPGIVSAGLAMKRTPKSKSTTNLVDAHSSFKSLASLETESHFTLNTTSTRHNTPRSMISVRSERDISDLDSVVSAPSSQYHGPKLYKPPTSKSNLALIKNAITFSCLPSKVNETSRRKVLNVLEKVEHPGHFMILFRDQKLQYRAVYDYDDDCDKLHKITGNGPSIITPGMVEDLYKYNSGKRTFSRIPSKSLSISIHAVTIKHHLWQHNTTSHGGGHHSSAMSSASSVSTYHKR